MFSLLNMELKQRIDAAVIYSQKRKAHIANAVYSLEKLPVNIRAEQIRGIYSFAEQIGKLKDNGTE
jgi:hypothetical protein